MGGWGSHNQSQLFLVWRELKWFMECHWTVQKRVVHHSFNLSKPNRLLPGSELLSLDVSSRPDAHSSLHIGKHTGVTQLCHHFAFYSWTHADHWKNPEVTEYEEVSLMDHLHWQRYSWHEKKTCWWQKLLFFKYWISIETATCPPSFGRTNRFYTLTILCPHFLSKTFLHFFYLWNHKMYQYIISVSVLKKSRSTTLTRFLLCRSNNTVLDNYLCWNQNVNLHHPQSTNKQAWLTSTNTFPSSAE